MSGREEERIFNVMGYEIKLTADGAILLPEELRKALSLSAGDTLTVERVGDRVVIARPAEQESQDKKKLTVDEALAMIPPFTGTPLSVEEMDLAVDRMWRERAARNDL